VTPPFFYGWIIVAISMLAGFFSAGVSNITMAVVLKPISDDLGWSRALTAAAVTALSAAFSILSTKVVWGSVHSLPGWSLTSAGNYQTIFAIFLANYLLSALLIFLPRRPVGRTGEGIME
jgi:hypothetical protein